ncbi:MAG TPA: hypothetical protein VM577_08275 [Anaerovoracaceae bacterium]|nr:hypothetical protein [Anaerovoracaceae bacterium]
MARQLYLIEAKGPDDSLYGLGVAESPAGARAWLVWFGRFYREEGWTKFNYYAVPAKDLEEMMAAAEEMNQ